MAKNSTALRYILTSAGHCYQTAPLCIQQQLFEPTTHNGLVHTVPIATVKNFLCTLQRHNCFCHCFVISLHNNTAVSQCIYASVFIYPETTVYVSSRIAILTAPFL